ncbi:hypothetical protein T11_10622 [Trichinella zimbabwensis]|uniref:Uncharacterized protein n=1 Tax=Trichinella zimbabwensis TaxID=268475 RepID=A0A0V1GRX2_9BILA|nr:hypothetical protein T11_10622 [Trichinella zimbabwensis]
MEDSTMTAELRKLHTLHTQLEMKIAICQKRYSHLDKILRKHDSGIGDVLLTVLIEIVDEEPCGSRRILLIGFVEEMLNILNAAEPRYVMANSISDPSFGIFGIIGITRMTEITNEETCAGCRRLEITFVEQVLNILNAAEIVYGEYHQRSLLLYIWHYWNHTDEPLRARCFSIFQSLLHAHGKNCI